MASLVKCEVFEQNELKEEVLEGKDFFTLQFLHVMRILRTYLLLHIYYSTSTLAGEGAIYLYLSQQAKIVGNIHETKSSGLFLS